MLEKRFLAFLMLNPFLDTEPTLISNLLYDTHTHICCICQVINVTCIAFGTDTFRRGSSAIHDLTPLIYSKSHLNSVAFVYLLYSLPILSLFCRIGKVGSQKRVVGVLLGSWHKKVLDVSNSFAGMFAALGAKCTSFQLKYSLSNVLIVWQCLLMRTTRMIQFGSWITTTWRICMACSRKWMVSLCYYAHVKNQYHTYDSLNFCHVIVLEHDLMSKLMVLFLSILARERIVGWYHTGPKLHKNDIAINELIKQYSSNSVCNTVCFTTD